MKSANDSHKRFPWPFILLGLLILSLVQTSFTEPVQKSHAEGNDQWTPDAPRCSEPRFKLTPKQLSISLWAREEVEALNSGKIPRQHTRDLDTLYREAAVADKDLREMILKLASCTGGTAVFPPGGGLKGRKRAEEKIEVELGGDASLLMDISRGSLEYDDVDQVYNALQLILRQGYPVVRLKDRALQPVPSGFWDIHLNLRMPNGHIAELQLHLRKIRQYSIKEGHKYYERVRTIKAGAYRENRPLTPEERETIDRLNCEQRRVYEEAFERGQRFRK